MLCFPGLTPVANDAHAVGDSGECVVASGYIPPCSASRLQVRQLALFDPSADERRIHAVEAEDDEPLRVRLWRRDGRGTAMDARAR